jgi:hypothetical protein
MFSEPMFIGLQFGPAQVKDVLDISVEDIYTAFEAAGYVVANLEERFRRVGVLLVFIWIAGFSFMWIAGFSDNQD